MLAKIVDRTAAFKVSVWLITIRAACAWYEVAMAAWTVTTLVSVSEWLLTVWIWVIHDVPCIMRATSDETQAILGQKKSPFGPLSCYCLFFFRCAIRRLRLRC